VSLVQWSTRIKQKQSNARKLLSYIELLVLLRPGVQLVAQEQVLRDPGGVDEGEAGFIAGILEHGAQHLVI